MSVVFCGYRPPWFFFKNGYWMCIVKKCSTIMTMVKIAGGADQAGGGDQGLGEGHRWTEAGDQGRQACPSDCYFFDLLNKKNKKLEDWESSWPHLAVFWACLTLTGCVTDADTWKARKTPVIWTPAELFLLPRYHQKSRNPEIIFVKSLKSSKILLFWQ